jgi:hypothetical protein
MAAHGQLANAPEFAAIATIAETCRRLDINLRHYINGKGINP